MLGPWMAVAFYGINVGIQFEQIYAQVEYSDFIFPKLAGLKLTNGMSMEVSN